MTNGLAELALWLDELDEPPSLDALFRFLRVMCRITSSREERGVQCVSVAEADGFVSRSRLLRQLADVAPEIVAGPFCLDAQYWIGTDKPQLQASAFVPVSAAAAVPSTKPFGVGLFTSTGNALSPHGMWRLYLDGWTVARHVWAIDTNGRPAVCEITTAAEWVEFVLTHPPLRPSTPVSLPLTAPRQRRSSR